MIREIFNLDVIARVIVIGCLVKALYQHYHTVYQIRNDDPDARSITTLLLYELVWFVVGIFVFLLIVLT